MIQSGKRNIKDAKRSRWKINIFKCLKLPQGGVTRSDQIKNESLFNMQYKRG